MDTIAAIESVNKQMDLLMFDESNDNYVTFTKPESVARHCKEMSVYSAEIIDLAFQILR
jgi:hypothetical protein